MISKEDRKYLVLIFSYFFEQPTLVRIIGEICILVTYRNGYLGFYLKLKSPMQSKSRRVKDLMTTIQQKEASIKEEITKQESAREAMTAPHLALVPRRV